MRILRRFMFVESEPVEIQLVRLETDIERREQIDAAAKRAREAMGRSHLCHESNRIQRLKEAA